MARQSRLQYAFQILTRITLRVLNDFFRRPFGNNFAATRAAFRPEVNNPVGRFYYIEIMLDDKQSIARFAQFEKDFEQFGNVVKVEAGCRLIQNVKRPAGRFAA